MSGESRMAKILRRLAGKDEENQESAKNEEKMSEHKDTGKKDLDFDLGDIAGDVAKDPKSPESNPTPKEKPFESLRAKTPMSKLKKTVDDHLEDAWICFVKNGKLEHRELHDATAEEFGAWLKWIYPPSIEFLKQNEKLYESYDKRKNEFMNIVAFLTRLPKMFEQYGEKKVFPRTEKTKEEKKPGGKNE
jgi:hypothetical protein